MSPSVNRPEASRPSEYEVVKTSYTSNAVPIPDSFLAATAASAAQVTYHRIDFAQTELPEYAGLYAAVLDNVLSRGECAELLKLAQRSAGADDEPGGAKNDGWQPAMVNAGPQGEFFALSYRNSDRIIWDDETVVRRLLMRCFQAEQLKEDLAVLQGNDAILGSRAVSLGHRWKATRLNERMRFLRYGKGQFFREHCDGTYITPDGRERTFYTLHLYLNDSGNANPPAATTTGAAAAAAAAAAASPPPPFPEPLLQGGATSFHSHHDPTRRLDVEPRAGRVLIFQHRDLLHSGADVLAGVKYTMRTDLLFEMDPDCAPALNGAADDSE